MDTTQLLLSHGGIHTLPEARVQGESVSTCVGDSVMFRWARTSELFLEQSPAASHIGTTCPQPYGACCQVLLGHGYGGPFRGLHLDAQLGVRLALLFIRSPLGGNRTQMHLGPV
jgi:hypothetical protein